DPLCGGSLYAHIAYPRQLEIKAQVISDALGRIGKIAWRAPIAVAASPEDGYRMRARLHLRGRRIGFFREATHDLCDPRRTRQLLPSTCDVLDRFVEALGESATDAGAELEVSENVEASERVLHVETNAPPSLLPLDRLAAVPGITGL